jgi:hypothetical protein
MIRRYNFSQTLKAILFAIGGLICCWLAYLFFRYLPVVVAWQLGYSLPPLAPVGLGLAGLAAAWVSGYRSWKCRGGPFGYHESALYHDLGTDTAGAVVTDFYAHRITAPAYVLGQVFMAGPGCLLRAWTLFRSRIPQSPELEAKLENAWAILRAANKWQSLDEYPSARDEILFLARMGLIDFSGHNGQPRIKAD